MSHPYFYHTNDLTKTLAYSHYSDPAFNGPSGAVIFGQDEPGLTWEYGDRFDRAKADAIYPMLVNKVRTAARWQEFLSRYYGRPVLLRCIVSGTRLFDGYAWYAYGFVFVSEVAP